MMVRKKWLLFFCVLFLLLVAAVYIFIPGELSISQVQLVKCNSAGAFRVVNDESSWKKWWPEKGINGYSYRVPGKLYREVAISLEGGDGPFEGRINFIPINGQPDSAALQWQILFPTSLNPLKRVQRYRLAVQVRHTIDTALSLLRRYLEKGENVYGMDIHNEMSRDSCLVMTRWVASAYPGTLEIYKAIGDLRTYATSEGGKETHFPMLHVSHEPDGKFSVMVALPVDRRIKSKGAILQRGFVPWKILTGEVRGGSWTAERAMDQLQLCLGDYGISAMAIPFQSLVTERDREPDTSRWVTRVIVPIP
jgi:hypothetical protein